MVLMHAMRQRPTQSGLPGARRNGECFSRPGRAALSPVTVMGEAASIRDWRQAQPKIAATRMIQSSSNQSHPEKYRMAKAGNAMGMPFAYCRVALCPDECPERQNAPPIGIGRGVWRSGGNEVSVGALVGGADDGCLCRIEGRGRGRCGFRWVLHNTPRFDPGVVELASDVATVAGSSDDRDFRVDRDDGDGSFVCWRPPRERETVRCSARQGARLGRSMRTFECP
jgi:hypothetical protein